MEVKILSFRSPLRLEHKIQEMHEYGFFLVGSVTVGINENGNTIYVATMAREVK